MKLQQLRFLCAVVDKGLNISAAAISLNTSQPGMSRQIKLLEKELGTPLLIHRRKRVVGLTNAGDTVVNLARRMLQDVENIRKAGAEHALDEEGNLTIATTHTHARYTLPKAVREFVRQYPKVRLTLRQGNPMKIAEWVTSGAADLGVAARPLAEYSNLLLLPCYQQYHVAVTPPGHPLLKIKRITLKAIADYPMITYDLSYTGRSQIAQTFTAAGLAPHIAVGATDSDVMKAYVKLGLGVAIVAEDAFDSKEDQGLRAVKVRHLFKANTIYVQIEKHSYLRSYAYSFIELLAPQLTRATVERELGERVLSKVIRN